MESKTKEKNVTKENQMVHIWMARYPNGEVNCATGTEEEVRKKFEKKGREFILIP